MKFRIIFLLIFFVISKITAGTPGSYSGKEFFIDPNVRSSSLGGSGVSALFDNNGIYLNPANLTFCDRNNISFIHTLWLADIRLNYLSLCQKIDNKRTLGFGLQYFDFGVIKHTYILPSNNYYYAGNLNSYGTINTFSYSQKLSELDSSFGFNFKFLYEKLAVKKIKAFFVDFGFLKRINLTESKANFGISIKNIGPKVKYYSVKEKVPIEFNLGFSFDILNNILLSFDVNKSQDNKFGFKTGIEGNFINKLYLRTGYNSLYDIEDALSVGFGLNLDYILLNYSYVPGGEINNVHKFEFAYRFGKPEKEKVEEKKEKIIETEYSRNLRFLKEALLRYDFVLAKYYFNLLFEKQYYTNEVLDLYMDYYNYLK
ncbi:MAG TPA: PorV/PorQ family protein [bacterium]|nr:PorV/PorQ family protein [bacterium]HOL47719.1 PorV/PorQ family protein [bacterium]HPQ18063.1 PorV/PorQ family protein [bacterium]